MKNKFAKNYFFNVVYQLLNIAFPLITITYVSRVLLPEGVGKVSYAQNIVSYFVLIASLGMPRYGIREIAKSNGDEEARNKTFSELLAINLITTLIASIVYYIIIFSVDVIAENRLLYIACGITLIFNCFNIDWFYKGIEEFKYIAVRSFWVKLISLFAILIAVNSQDDVEIYAFISSLATSANYLFNIIHAHKYVTVSRRNLNLKHHIKPVLFMFATSVAVELYTQLDTTMIGAMCGDKWVGYYTNPSKLTKIVSTVIVALGEVLLPSMSVFFKHGDLKKLRNLSCKVLDYMIFLSLPACIGLILISKEVILVLFGEAFQPSILTLEILSLLIPILSIGNIYGSQLMVVLNMEKKLTLSVTIGSLANLMMNYFLIIKFKQNGAAIASVATEFLVMLIQILIVRKILDVKPSLKNTIQTVIQTGFMAFVILFIEKLGFNDIITLVFALCFGLVSYFACALIINNQYAREILAIIKRK
jgi:O-antigen/teichoic acid export membrane protein